MWLWVQAVDALCLRFLLGDAEITQSAVLAGYHEQFTFGATQRVKVRWHQRASCRRRHLAPTTQFV